MTLLDLIVQNRDELILRTRNKVVLRSAPRSAPREIVNGVPIFLTQLVRILEQEAARQAMDGSEMGVSATLHGGELLKQGFSIGQVVHGYGDVCQAVTELALERGLPIGTEDFHTLNRCLDDAIASAVTEYARAREVDLSEAEVRRQGFFAHELRNHLQTAMVSFQVVKSGTVGVTGSTIGVLERSLQGLGYLIDRSVSEVRLIAGLNHKERIRVAELIEETEVQGSLEATKRDLQFSVGQVDNTLHVDVDRQLFGSAISNLVQNAFKFTRPSSHVRLRTTHDANRVSIEVEDECGGLPPGATETLFQPFEQRGDHPGGGWDWGSRSAARPSRRTAARLGCAISRVRAVSSSSRCR